MTPITFPVYELKGRKTIPDPQCGAGTLGASSIVLELAPTVERNARGGINRSAIEAVTNQSKPKGTTPGAVQAENARVHTLRSSVRRGIQSGLDAWLALHGTAPKLSRLRVTRLSFGELDDTNLVGALKPVEDGVADAFQINDRHFSMFGAPGRIPYELRQEHCARGEKGVRVEVFFEEA